MRRSIEERFWAKVEKSDGCWNWSASTTTHGYGQINIYGAIVYAHRLSWEIHYGKIKKEMHILHRCDNPPCIRPDHLFIGTPLDNMRDCISKGRARHPSMPGEASGASKLSEKEVKEIRSKYKTLKMLASEYGVSEGTINFVIQRKTWRHI